MSNRFYEKHSEWLIPMLCLVVIFQTVMLIGGSPRDQVAELLGKPPVGEVNSNTEPQAVGRLVFVPESVTAEKNQPVTVEIWLKPDVSINLGGMDLVLKFDPEAVALTKVEAEELFSLSNVNRQSEKTGRAFVTYLDDTQEGLTINADKKVLSLTMTAKQSGQVDLGLVTGGSGARTVLTDKVSSMPLPISVGSLLITVTEK